MNADIRPVSGAYHHDQWIFHVTARRLTPNLDMKSFLMSTDNVLLRRIFSSLSSESSNASSCAA